MEKLTAFLQESKQELKRVNWPSVRETTRLTGVVIGISVLIAVLLGAFDMLFTLLLEATLL